MSLSTFIKLVSKALRFTFKRPIQRFNIYNRLEKYLGPNAKYFMPAPRAIGPMHLNEGKPVQYLHLGDGFKSVKQRRLEALKKNEPISSEPAKTRFDSPKSYSEDKKEDNLVIEASSILEVTKTIVKVESEDLRENKLIDEDCAKKPSRPLPKSTNLDLSDPAGIWVIDKTPPGRLDLNMLQDLMINKLSDDKYWTTKVIADKYNIKEEYVENLVRYLKQIRIVISPRMAKLLDYTGRNDSYYQSARHIVYHVDKNLRSDVDKKYDKMFLPNEELDEEVKELLDLPDAMQVTSCSDATKIKRIFNRPGPLRLAPLNKETQESNRKLNQQPKRLNTGQDSDSNGIT